MIAPTGEGREVPSGFKPRASLRGSGPSWVAILAQVNPRALVLFFFLSDGQIAILSCDYTNDWSLLRLDLILLLIEIFHESAPRTLQYLSSFGR